MSENGPSYVCKAVTKACRTIGLRYVRTIGLRYVRTRPYTPRSNGNAEMFIQTFVKSGLTECRSKTQENRSAGYPATWNLELPQEAIGPGQALNSAAARRADPLMNLVRLIC
jgi:hypothetical protein